MKNTLPHPLVLVGLDNLSFHGEVTADFFGRFLSGRPLNSVEPAELLKAYKLVAKDLLDWLVSEGHASKTFEDGEIFYRGNIRSAADEIKEVQNLLDDRLSS